MYAYMMYLPDTEPVALRTVHSNKQCINLNSNDFRGGVLRDIQSIQLTSTSLSTSTHI